MKRDVRLDALKGAVILLVVLSHAIQDYPAPGSYVPLRILTFIDMPLFMMLTGYALGYARPRSPREQIVHRAKTLLIPYVSWGLLTPMLYGERPDVFMTLTGRSGPWFLLAVFVFEVALIGLKRLTQSPWRLVGCAYLVALLAYVLADLPAMSSYRLVEDIAHFFLFYVAGHVAFHVMPGLRGDRRATTFIASSVFAVAVMSLLAFVAVGTAEPAAWVESATRVVTELARVSIGLSAGLVAVVAVRAVREDRLRVLAWLGQMSLGIYLIHLELRHRVTGIGWDAVMIAFVVWVALSILGTLVIQHFPLSNRLLLGGRVARREVDST